MVLDIDDSINTFVPDVDDNKNAPDSERMEIDWTTLGYDQDSHAARIAQAKSKLGKQGKSDTDWTRFVDVYNAECFCARIVAIRNITVRSKKGEERDITTALELYEGKGKLAEITAQFVRHISEIEAVPIKKSKSASASGSTDSPTTTPTS